MKNLIFNAPAKVIADTITAAYSAEVATKAYKTTLYNVALTDELTARINAVASWATSDSAKPGLVLHSQNPGTGKTTMVRALFRVVQGFNTEAKDFYMQTATRDLYAELEQYYPGMSGNYDIAMEEDPDKATRKKAQAIIGKITAICEKVEEDWMNYSCAYKDAAFFSSVELALTAQNGGREALLDAENAPAKVPLLFIDDLGIEPRSVRHYGKNADGDYRNEDILPLVELITYRYEHGLPVIITTNFASDVIGKLYGERIADRLREMCEFGNFAGESFRK